MIKEVPIRLRWNTVGARLDERGRRSQRRVATKRT
jgi:hypothetical protein